jgi:hypothetical protein
MEMTTVLKRISFVFGLGLLLISIHWSQDGFNFNVAGDSGGTSSAIYIGYFIAAASTVLQFVFSTNLKNLNASLIVFGLIAYGYSIYTNYQGIIHFQGTEPNEIMAFVLGLAMDGVPEPLMAWALGESLSGDFIGNLFKGFGAFMTGKPLGSGGGSQQQRQTTDERPTQSHKHNGQGGQNHQSQGNPNKKKMDERRAELEVMRRSSMPMVDRRQGGGERKPEHTYRDLNENGDE